MATKFGNGFTTGGLKGKERQLLIFLISAGAAFFLVVIGLVGISMMKKDGNKAEVAAVPAARPVAPVSSVNLFITAQGVRVGTSLDDVKFNEAYWPRHTVPDDAILDRTELKGKFAAREIPENVPITRKDISTEKKVESLPITPGMRAVTIQVDAASSIEGWARPGARVDVVLTFQEGGELKSKVIAQNARVLSAGGESQANNLIGTASRATSVSTITLEVTPNDALVIQTSRQLGSLSLLMRSAADEKAVSTTEVGAAQIRGGGQGKKRTESCNSGGTMRIGGKEYIIDCNGQFQPLMNTDEP